MNLSEQLELIDGTETMVSQCLSVVKEHDEIVIFGGGVGGGALYKLLKTNKLENRIKSWSDNNVLKHYQPYMQEELERANHNYELQESDSTVFCIDYAQNGIGSNSCGPEVQEKYQLNEEQFAFGVELILQL